MPKSPSTHSVESPVVSAATEGVSVVVPNADAPVTRSPEKWAEVYFPASERGRLHNQLWKHAAAMQLHGWAAYAARTGKPVLLTAQQYEKAVAAVSGNDFKPHHDADYRTRS
jgi:hypothetical protein